MSNNLGKDSWNGYESDEDYRALTSLTSAPPLDRDEEREMFRRYKAGDQDALEKIIMSNQRFVMKMARSFFASRLPLSDLVQEGNIGMMIAARKFSPDRGIRFITYARWWIKQSMQAASLSNGYIVSLPKRNWSESQAALRWWNEYENETGMVPTAEEISKGAKCPLFTAQVAQVQRAGECSLDGEIVDDYGSSVDTLMNHHMFSVPPEQEEMLDRISYERGVELLLLEFDGKQLEALEIMLSKESNECGSIRELAERTGVSRQAIDARIKIIREMVQVHPRFKGIKSLVKGRKGRK